MNQMDEPLHDLIEIIHFTEKVSAKIHGLLDEAEIYRTIREESAQSNYTVSILLLTNDRSKLTIAETFIPYQKLKKAEKATGLILERYTIDLEKSTTYSQVVREGKTIQAKVGDIIAELVPQPGASIISALFGYKQKCAILTPLRRHGKIIGALAMSSTQLAEYFIPSVKSLAEHISTALELSHEYAKRRQAEESLQESEEALKTIMENVNDIIFQLSPSFLITYVSPTVRDYGYEPEDLIGNHLRMTTPAHEVARALEVVESVLSGNTVKNFEIDQLDSKGKIIPMEINFAPVVKEGQVVAVQGVMRDITERKQAEKEKDRILHDLGERVKELSCLYKIDEITKRDVTVEEVLEETVHVIPPSWQYPEITESRITFEDREYKTGNFRKTQWMQKADVYVNDKKVGVVEVCYTDEKPPEDEGPFSREERKLMNSIAKRLGDFIERKKAEETLKYRLDFEELIATISTYFINLGPDEIDEGITLALEKVGRFTGVDRCDVFLLYDNGTKMDNTHEWCAEGVESQKDQLQRLDVESLKWGIGQLKKLEVLNIPCVADLPEEASVDKEVLQAEGIQSLLSVPIFIGGVLFGFVGLDSIRTKRTWSDDTVSMLKMVAEIFANALERKRSEEVLQESEEQYRTTIDSMGDAIHVVDDDLRIVLANESFKKWCIKLGLDTEAVGKTPFELFSFLQDKIRDEYRHVFSTGKTLITEERTTILGKEFVSETRKIPIVEEGKVCRVVTVVHDITERKRAEEQLQASEEKFRTLFENQGVGIALGELSTLSTGEIRPMEFNAALLQFLGYSREEFRAKTMADLSHPEDVKKDIELLNKALAENRDSYEMEKRFIRKDGQIVWGHLTVSLLRDAHGNPTHVIGSVQDITERKHSQEALRKSEEEFRLAFENAKDAIFWADPETGLIIRCNKAAETLLEKKREEIIGCHQTEVHPPEKADYYKDIFKRHTVQKGAEDVEAEVITTSGTIKPVHISASLTLVGGKPILQGIFRDITERKKAEEALRESEEKYRTLVEQSLQGIAIAQGIPLHIVFANTALAEISGYTVEELLSFSLEDTREVIYSEDLLFTLERYRDRLKGEPVPPRYEFRIIRKDGEVHWLELYVSRIEYQGSPAVQAAIMDITERKKAEEQIKQSLREKEVLLREIHHRVKNNLQVVSSLLNLQSSHSKDRQYTELLKESQNRIRTMALIHENLYQSENLADINFNEYISNLVQGLVRSYKAERVTLTLDVGDVSLGIDAAIPCGLIINELVSNSLKHAFPDKKGEIEIKLHPVNGKVELVVADNGIGIPDTVDFKNTETLGLDLVTTLAEEQLNGEITLDKTKGTAFTIVFEEVI